MLRISFCRDGVCVCWRYDIGQRGEKRLHVEEKLVLSMVSMDKDNLSTWFVYVADSGGLQMPIYSARTLQ